MNNAKIALSEPTPQGTGCLMITVIGLTILITVGVLVKVLTL